MADDLAPETPAAGAEAPDAAVAETISLADHQDIFGPPDPTLEGDAKVKNEEARAKVRHRAKSQQAGPEDAPRIQELTKKLRAAEAERDALKTPPASSPPAREDRPQGTPTALPARAETSQQAGLQPTRPKPDVNNVGSIYDTYEAYIEDLADWKSDQRDAAREAKQRDEWQQRQQSEAHHQWTQAHATYAERLAEFTKTHADFPTLLAQHAAVNIPAAAYQAILRAENGPGFVYHLLQHPDHLAEVVLLFDGKPPSDEFVAHATRWLSSRTQAASTGSAAPAPPLTLAPRPPNPVRTGAAKSDGDPPGDESMSLAEHERAYGRRRR